jgi:predicted unusual protein kinase regulating ubiquinone biosynthesis (AarF/ABC1/UbiB family)
MKLGVPGIEPRELLAGVKDGLLSELDYTHEAKTQRAFRAATDDGSDIIVPRVIVATDCVLVTEWVDGTPLSEIIRSGTTQQRDRAGQLLLRFFLSSPERVGLVHGDPHPGNFRLLDDRLIVLDFGSAEAMPRGWPPVLGQLFAAGRDRDAARLKSAFVTAGLISDGDVTSQELAAILDPWFESLRRDTFHFERRWLRQQTKQWSNPTSPAAGLQRKLRIPVRHLLVQRVAFGLLGVLTSLDATVAVRAEIEHWIRGLE